MKSQKLKLFHTMIDTKKRKILLKKHVSEASKYEFDHLSVDNKRNV